MYNNFLFVHASIFKGILKMSPNHYHKIIVIPKFGVCFTIVWLVFDGLCYIFFFYVDYGHVSDNWK